MIGLRSRACRNRSRLIVLRAKRSDKRLRSARIAVSESVTCSAVRLTRCCGWLVGAIAPNLNSVCLLSFLLKSFSSAETSQLHRTPKYFGSWTQAGSRVECHESRHRGWSTLWSGALRSVPPSQSNGRFSPIIGPHTRRPFGGFLGPDTKNKGSAHSNWAGG